MERPAHATGISVDAGAGWDTVYFGHGTCGPADIREFSGETIDANLRTAPGCAPIRPCHKRSKIGAAESIDTENDSFSDLEIPRVCGHD